MVTIPVSRLRPGMIVGKPVLDGEEVTVIGAGIILSGRHIAALKERGVNTVAIAEDDEIQAVNVAEVAESARIDDQQVAAATEELEGRIDALFADVMDDDVMILIAEEAKAFLVVKMQG